ncbi:MAG TPA: hypothetical protein VFF69_08220 [Phycisphaerales bacterium]|nr:hypothetical protein [Phycisphaerales bacterium]
MEQSHAATPEQQLRTIQVLVWALMAGLVVFAATAVVVGPGGPMAPAQPSSEPVRAGPLLPVLGALMAGCAGAFFAFGAAAKKQARKAWEARADEEDGRAKIIAVLSTSSILRAALVEGPGLFACVVVLLSGEPLPLAGAAIAVGLMATLLPVRSRLAQLEEAATGMRAIR